MFDLKQIISITIGVAIAMILVSIIKKQFPALNTWESDETLA